MEVVFNLCLFSEFVKLFMFIVERGSFTSLLLLDEGRDTSRGHCFLDFAFIVRSEVCVVVRVIMGHSHLID
jgi:hypothetical protein